MQQLPLHQWLRVPEGEVLRIIYRDPDGRDMVLDIDSARQVGTYRPENREILKEDK